MDRVSDPAPLLGLQHTPPLAEDSAALRGRRSRAFAEVQEHYYQDPPRIERGWREHLIGTDGRVYLDMVNNVAVIGHGHPALADAAARQWRRLNTNSRFNYASVATFSERLAATLPDPLDTVFLVNSGSESDDLALRLAMATTGRQDVVAVAEAYHDHHHHRGAADDHDRRPVRRCGLAWPRWASNYPGRLRRADLRGELCPKRRCE